MIQRLEVNGAHQVKVWPGIQRHIEKKIGRLDRFVPRHAKKSIHARVILSTTQAKKKLAVCEVILELPHQTISAKETNENMFAAVDLVETKLARQIRKYKTAHFEKNKRLFRRLLDRSQFWRS